VAIANPASHRATVYFQPTDNSGTPISTPYPNVVSVTIPAFGHVSSFTRQLFLPGFPLPRTGLLRIWTDSTDGISVAGFRADTNQRGDLLITNIPVSSESNGGTPTSTYFPIMVEGSGYTTELVVFGNAPGQNTSGAIQYYSQSGAPVAILLN
jgi:hypothetical protein